MIIEGYIQNISMILKNNTNNTYKIDIFDFAKFELVSFVTNIVSSSMMGVDTLEYCKIKSFPLSVNISDKEYLVGIDFKDSKDKFVDFKFFDGVLHVVAI